MSEYVPTTEDVFGAFQSEGDGGVSTIPGLHSRKEFDTWLNSIKADAWDEGFDAGEQDVMQHEQHDWANACIVNPYRNGGKNV